MPNNYLSIYAKSFSWAGFFLPKKTYQNCSNLYDFCRTLDDIADQELSLNIKIKQFEEFKKKFLNKDSNNQILRNMHDLIDNFKISKKIVYDLFDGVESDLKKEVKINSKKELLIYSYRVAGTVGLMMAKILNVNKKNTLRAAIDLGIAMQLTNIARDVVEDNIKNREYIKPDFNSIKNTLIIAESFYKSSFLSISDIPIVFRFSILVARRVYRKIGYKILNKKNIENYKKSGKIYVSNIEKIIETFLSIYDLIKLSLIGKNDDNNNHDHNLINEEINLNERI